MEKDKKYNVVLGLMIFFFILVVGISLAWGLGYIHFGKSEQENVGAETTIDENKQNINANLNADVNTNNKINSQVTNKEEKKILEEAYKKYDFDWASKKEDNKEIGTVYVQDGKVKIIGNEESYYNGTYYETPKKIIEVKFKYGNPVLAEVATYYDFMAFVVITDEGEVYISNQQEVPETRIL